MLRARRCPRAPSGASTPIDYLGTRAAGDRAERARPADDAGRQHVRLGLAVDRRAGRARRRWRSSRSSSSSAAPPSRSCRRRCSATACSRSRARSGSSSASRCSARSTYLPLFQQVVRGLSPTASGLQLLPLMGGLLITSIVSGQIITRTGRYKVFPIVGTAIAALGLFLLSALDAGDRRRRGRAVHARARPRARAWSCRCSCSPSRTRCPTSSSAWRRRARRCSARSAARSAPRSSARSSPAGSTSELCRRRRGARPGSRGLDPSALQRLAGGAARGLHQRVHRRARARVPRSPRRRRASRSCSRG